jgi:hypothetical protein
MESFEDRLNRFKSGPPVEFIETLINSTHNYFIPQLRMAKEKGLESLLILGIHSVAETLSENIFGRNYLTGFRFYLENFVDGKEDGFKFSEIAEDLNNWRNIIAHQFLSKLGHFFVSDTTVEVGFKKDGEQIFFNPNIYFDYFESSFTQQPKSLKSIHNYKDLMSEDDMNKAKEKILKKFERR